MTTWREVWKDDYRAEAERLQEIRKPARKPKLVLIRKSR